MEEGLLVTLEILAYKNDWNWKFSCFFGFIYCIWGLNILNPEKYFKPFYQLTSSQLYLFICNNKGLFGLVMKKIQYVYIRGKGQLAYW